MIFYHFKDLTDYLQYLKSGEYTYVNLDVQEVETKTGLDFYAVMTVYNMEKERVYVGVHRLGSYQRLASHVQSAATHLGLKEDAASKKAFEAQQKADELSRTQQREALLKAFKTQAARIYREVEFSEFERRWSSEPLVHLPKSVEAGEALSSAASAGGGAVEESKPGAKSEKKSQSKPAAAEGGASKADDPVQEKGEEEGDASATATRGLRSRSAAGRPGRGRG